MRNFGAMIAMGVFLLTTTFVLADEDRETDAKKRVEPKVETVLDWLPADTESVAVANGLEEIHGDDAPAKEEKPPPIARSLQLFAYAELGDMHGGDFFEAPGWPCCGAGG